jgi:hypothetical protein
LSIGFIVRLINLKVRSMDRCYHGTITENKCWEIDISTSQYNSFDFRLTFSTKVDHAGLKFCFAVCKFELRASIYDHRHWNYETDSWEKY